jgi:hypothetical protein
MQECAAPEAGMDSKLWNLESGIYGIDLKNGIWNMEYGMPKIQNRRIYFRVARLRFFRPWSVAVLVGFGTLGFGFSKIIG